MKKKCLFGLAGLAVMAAAVTVTISSVNANSPESDLLTKNLEALTRGEFEGGDCTGPSNWLSGRCRSKNEYGCMDQQVCN